MIYGHLLPRISAFTVAAQHGEPINFASAPIKTDIAPFGEKSGRRFEEGETRRECRSKKFSLQNRENDFQNYITFTLSFFSIPLLLYLSLPLSGFSLSQVFPLGLVSVGKSWTSLRNSIDKRDHRKLFHATLSANVLVPRRRFERGRADVRRHDAECVPKIRPHFGTAHRAR